MDKPTGEPITIVIFGASGDLTRRKLAPALFSLACGGLLPEQVSIVGVARSEYEDDAFRERLLEGAREYARLSPAQCANWPKFAPRIQYQSLAYDSLQSYQEFSVFLDDLDREHGVAPGHSRRLFYLATPPQLYPTIIQHLGASGLSRSSDGWVRVVIEKPFGHDLSSATKLNRQVHESFDETRVYRIDHYLGKETVQNLLVFRFANAIFEPLWNRNYIDHVQITMAESIGVGHRAGYYDKAGVLRDMFQNHMFQLLTLTAMESVAAFDAKSLRDEKVKVLRAVRPIHVRRDTLRGQYKGYRDEPNVTSDSGTATYGILKVGIDNWRWHGVPFYLRSGKQLPRKTTEILIQFKDVPHVMFDLPSGDDIAPNLLAICIQPDEGVHLRFETKLPGAGIRTSSVNMAYHYDMKEAGGALPDAYKRLLLDALQGDAALFARADEIERAWELIDPIAAAWSGDESRLCFYEPGTWGPAEADALLAASGRSWQLGCGGHG